MNPLKKKRTRLAALVVATLAVAGLVGGEAAAFDWPWTRSDDALYEYSIRITVDGRKPGGDPWDGGGRATGKPDVYVVVDASHAIKSAACRDAFLCVLPLREKRRLSFQLELWDEDLTADDVVGAGSVAVGRPTRVGGAVVLIELKR